MIRLRHQILICFGSLIFGLSGCQPEITPPQWHWQRAEVGLLRQAIMVAVAADPLDSDRLWVGYYAAGGLATSHDGGQTWRTGAEGVADNPVFDLLPVIYPADGKPQVKAWAATRDGLLASTDAGISWQPASGNLPPVAVFALAADAGGRVFVGLDAGGVYVQTEDDAGWEPLVAAVSPLATVGVISLAVSPDGQYLYAGTSGQGVFASPDGGQTWVNTYPGKYATNIALNPANPHQAIASLREQTVEDDNLAKLIEDLSTQDRLARTNDGGRSWHTLPLDWTSDEVTSLLWLPDGPLGAGTAKGQLFRSLDGGDTWQQGGVGLSGGGILDLAVAGRPEHPTRLLAAAWTGVYASDDGGQTWRSLAPELGVPNARILLSIENKVLLGTQTGLYQWQADSQSWQQLVANLRVSALAASPESSPLFMGTIFMGTIGDGVYHSDDTGSTWQNLPALGVGVPQLAVDPQNPNHLFLLAAWERPYESLDGGQTWQARWDGLGDVIETVSLAFDPLHPIVYVGTEAGLFHSYQGGVWQPVAFKLLDQSILALSAQVAPKSFWNDSMLYIGTTRGAYRSVDQGVTVQGVDDDPGWGYGLEDVSVTAFLVDPHEPRLLFAGTAYDKGVYQSVDGGKTWQPIGPGEVSEDVIESMAWGPNGEMFIVTTNGVWLGEKREGQ